MASSPQPGTSQITTSCDVPGCQINSMTNTEVSFFPLVRDPDRRRQWLKMMKREEHMENQRIQDSIRICSLHFCDEDIITSPFGNMLRKDAVPSQHMPSEESGDASAQVQPQSSEKRTQIEQLTTQSDMVCQKSSLMAELRRKRKMYEYQKAINRLMMMKSGTGKALLDMLHSSCSSVLGEQLTELVKGHFERRYGKKCTLTYKILCLNLYYASPQAYKLISEDFNLPPVKELKEIRYPMSTEYNEDIMETFRIKVRNMRETEKYCSVAMDYISLKYNLFYSTKQDKVIGFQEIDGIQSSVPARYAVVLVVRGIFKYWTQPIGFAFISANKSRENCEAISKWCDKVLAKLLDMGLYVKTFTCTAKSKLLNEANIRRVTVDKPYFYINNKKIYYIYDFLHMFTMLRNHFVTHDFYFNNYERKCVAKVEDVKYLFENERSKQLKATNVLTNSHLNPSAEEKRYTRPARQLLNKKVAFGISTCISFKEMHESARDTVQFLVMMNNLYDMMNCNELSRKTFRGNEAQIEILNNILNVLKSLKLINNSTGQEVTSKLLFAKGLQVTVKSVLLLFEDLQKDSFRHLVTGRLNLAGTEHLAIRMLFKGSEFFVPTGQQFALKFRRLFFVSILKPQGGGALISEDMDKAIAHLNELSEVKKSNGVPINRPPTSQQPGTSGSKLEDLNDVEGHIDDNPDSNVAEKCEMSIKELQEIAQISATVNKHSLVNILLKKCVEYHDCEMLKCFVRSYEISHNLLEGNEEIVKEEVTLTNEVVNYVERMEDKFREVFSNFRTTLDLVTSVYELFKTDLFLNTYAPCPCFPVELFQKMFIRVRVYMTLNYNNAKFRERGVRTFVIPELK